MNRGGGLDLVALNIDRAWGKTPGWFWEQDASTRSVLLEQHWNPTPKKKEGASL